MTGNGTQDDRDRDHDRGRDRGFGPGATGLLAPDDAAARAFGLALSHMTHGLVVFDAAERLTLCNDRYRELLGLPASVVREGIAYRVILERIMAPSLAGLDDAAREKRIGDVRVRRRAGAAGPSGSGREEVRIGERVVSIVYRAVPGGGWVSVLDDVTEQNRERERMLHLATHDPLTGLGNRALFRERLAAVPPGASGAVLYLDLDRFKRVNDDLGHEAGDGVLVAVAERLRAALPDPDHAARLGGDEFAVLLVGSGDPGRIGTAARELVAEIGRPIAVRDRTVAVGASVGIALFDGGDLLPDELIRRADAAFYRAKRDGRNPVRFFAP